MKITSSVKPFTSRHPFCVLHLPEALESRIAPAAIVTYNDIDGDKVTISDSSGTLLEAHLTIVDGQLQTLDLTDPGFQGAAITFAVKKVAGGDGLANVGYINATDRDLAAIKIKGDLGQIDAGDADPVTPAVKSLNAQSMGRYGIATQGMGGSFESNLTGAIGLLKIKGDVSGVWLRVQGGAEAKIGAVQIGGSLVGGSETHGGHLEATGTIGPVKIGGSIFGGSGSISGHISGSALGNVTIGGDLVGGTGGFSGMLYGNDSVGAVKIGGSVIGGGTTTGGGLGDNGFIQAGFGSMKSVTIGGSLIGGRGDFSGGIAVATGAGSTGTLGFLKIGGDMVGGSAGNSGTLFCVGSVTSVTIGGSLVGGSATQAGLLYCMGDIGTVKIGRDLRGGSGFFSGLILTQGGGDVSSVTVGGSLLGGSNFASGGISTAGDLGVVAIKGSIVGASIVGTAANLDSSGYIESGQRIERITVGGSIISGVDNSTVGMLTKNGTIRATDDIGSLVVKRGLIGNVTADGESPVIISARGQAGNTDANDLAINKVAIGGSVERALILAGYSPAVFGPATSFAAINGNAQIGSVTVGGDWVASSLVAGVKDDLNDGFGNSADTLIVPPASDWTAKIASIVIKGTVVGAAGPGIFYGFVSHEIGSFKIGGVKVPLAPGSASPGDVIPLSPATGDVTIREI
jgi:hypothetical protein